MSQGAHVDAIMADHCLGRPGLWASCCTRACSMLFYLTPPGPPPGASSGGLPVERTACQGEWQPGPTGARESAGELSAQAGGAPGRALLAPAARAMGSCRSPTTAIRAAYRIEPRRTVSTRKFSRTHRKFHDPNLRRHAETRRTTSLSFQYAAITPEARTCHMSTGIPRLT